MKTLILILCVFTALKIRAQSGPYAVNSSGLLLQNDQYSFDISIGEPIITTIIGSNGIFTQGYLQPQPVKTTYIYQSFDNLGIKVYPNPFNNIITIESKFEDLQFMIKDITGKIVFEGFNTKSLELAFLSSGIYHLIISDASGHTIAIEKICKTG